MRSPKASGLRRRMGIVGWFALLLATIATVALLAFWAFLADYQRSLPQNLAEQIFSAYQSGDAKTISEACVNLPESLENPALFQKYYAENTSLENLYFYQGTSKNLEKLCYEFVSGNNAIATLILQKTGLESRFGFPEYEIESLTGHPLKNYQITAPSDTLLFVDGKLVSEQYHVGEGSTDDSFLEMTGKTYATKSYEIKDFTYIDTLDAVGMDGCECVVTWDAEHHIATVEKKLGETLETQIHDFAVEFAKAYSVFATRQNGSRVPVLQLLYPGTAFYKALLLYNNDWGEAYVNDRYDNQTVDSFVRYSPTEFSCNISFGYVITFQNGFEKTYPYNMTYYLTNQNGRLQLVDMQTRMPDKEKTSP